MGRRGRRINLYVNDIKHPYMSWYLKQCEDNHLELTDMICGAIDEWIQWNMDESKKRTSRFLEHIEYVEKQL